ncbi:MAG: hypothetical protein KC561_04470, partial [Myxococcales bacterium]|nr:hypothetical protein [Myxococcales bacterium]
MPERQTGMFIRAIAAAAVWGALVGAAEAAVVSAKYEVSLFGVFCFIAPIIVAFSTLLGGLVGTILAIAPWDLSVSSVRRSFARAWRSEGPQASAISSGLLSGTLWIATTAAFLLLTSYVFLSRFNNKLLAASALTVVVMVWSLVSLVLALGVFRLLRRALNRVFPSPIEHQAVERQSAWGKILRPSSLFIAGMLLALVFIAFVWLRFSQTIRAIRFGPVAVPLVIASLAYLTCTTRLFRRPLLNGLI